MSRPINIKASDVNFGQVIIDSPELVEALITDQENALNFIEEKISAVSLDKISVDKYGRLIIDDENFRQSLENVLQDETSGDNSWCGGGCK